jgi:bifunctional non-homologous end joining protein LigD
VSLDEASVNDRFFIEPIKSLPIENLPEGDWLYEIKFDGYRALTFKDGKERR